MLFRFFSLDRFPYALALTSPTLCIMTLATWHLLAVTNALDSDVCLCTKHRQKTPRMSFVFILCYVTCDHKLPGSYRSHGDTVNIFTYSDRKKGSGGVCVCVCGGEGESRELTLTVCTSWGQSPCVWRQVTRSGIKLCDFKIGKTRNSALTLQATKKKWTHIQKRNK